MAAPDPRASTLQLREAMEVRVTVSWVGSALTTQLSKLALALHTPATPIAIPPHSQFPCRPHSALSAGTEAMRVLQVTRRHNPARRRQSCRVLQHGGWLWWRQHGDGSGECMRSSADHDLHAFKLAAAGGERAWWPARQH